MVEPTSRHRFSGYVLAAPILVTAAELAATCQAAARPPSSGGAGLLGLNHIMTAAALPGSGLISVEVGTDGTVSLVLPRPGADQGSATSTATLIAEELSVPLGRVRLTRAGVWPRPPVDRLTGAATDAGSPCAPLRVAAAVARHRLLAAAAVAFGSPVADLRLASGVITDGAGRRLDIGALAVRAASSSTVAVTVELAPRPVRRDRSAGARADR